VCAPAVAAAAAAAAAARCFWSAAAWETFSEREPVPRAVVV